jgi:hypothetical protein
MTRPMDAFKMVRLRRIATGEGASYQLPGLEIYPKALSLISC